MFFEIITRVGLLLLFATVIPIVFNAGCVAVCLWRGVRFTQVALFYGKPVFTIQTRVTPVTIGFIPTGGFVQLDMDAFPAEPRLTRFLVTLAGPLAVFLSSIACLGFLHASQSFLMTFPQFVDFLLSPASSGTHFVPPFLRKLASSPIAAYGVVAAKAAAVNFFPFAPLSGGRMLIELTEKRDKSKLARILNYISSLVAVVVIVCFIVGIIGYFRKH